MFRIGAFGYTAATVLLATSFMVLADRLLGRDSPSFPGAIAAILSVLTIALLQRFGPHEAIEPRRRLVQFGAAMAACAMIAGLALLINSANEEKVRRITSPTCANSSAENSPSTRLCAPAQRLIPDSL